MLADGTQVALFVVEVLTVLAIPGPTNSLLFVSGVSRGFQASLKLIVAEIGAYLISLSLLMSALKPVISAYPTTPQLLRVACSIALVYVAVKLWQSGGPATPAAHPITVRRVFVTTLMNPKNLIFAFGIFPPPTTGFSDLLPYLAGFAAICACVACGWIAAGAWLHSRAADQLRLQWVYRSEACLLGGFAIMLVVSAYYGRV